MKKLLSILLLGLSIFSFNLEASAAKSTDLNTTKALKMALDARQHYWDTMTGHIYSKKNTQCSLKTFQYKGKEYRYFCNELGTKKKLINYLDDVFTLNAINKGIKKYSIIEYKGKLAQPNADGGSLLEWEKAKVKLIYSRADVRQYEFKVPYGEKVQYEKKKVTFVKVKDKWLINEMDAVR